MDCADLPAIRAPWGTTASMRTTPSPSARSRFSFSVSATASFVAERKSSSASGVALDADDVACAQQRGAPGAVDPLAVAHEAR